jgi:hypothetical protein
MLLVSCTIVAKDSYLDLEYEHLIIFHIAMRYFYIDVQTSFHIWQLSKYNWTLNRNKVNLILNIK